MLISFRPRLFFSGFGAFGHLFHKLFVIQHKAQAAHDVLQTEDVQVGPVHARAAVGEDDHAVIVVEGGEGRVEDAGIGVDPHEADGLRAERFEQAIEIGPHEAVEALFVVDDVVALFHQARNHLRRHLAHDVVLVHRAVAAGAHSVFLVLNFVEHLPEGVHHPLAAHAGYFAEDELDVDNGDPVAAGEFEDYLGVPDHALGILLARRHGRYLWVQVSPVHVDGDDGHLIRVKMCQFFELARHVRAV